MVYCIHQLREPRPVCPLMKVFQDFLVAQWLRLPSKAGGTSSIPGQGANIPHALGPKKPKHKTDVTESINTLKNEIK